MNLITPFEVLRYSTAGFDYPTAQFCELIPQIEQGLARDCLGADLYDWLVSKMAEYPDGTEEWSAATEYDEGDLAIRNGCLFVSTADGNEDHDPLTDTDNWEPFERFTDAGAMELWERYLRRLLAIKVYSASLTYTTWRVGAGGLAINTGDTSGFRSAKKEELSDMKANLIHEAQLVTANMLEWLRKNYVELGIPFVEPLCGTGCDVPGRRSRRWAFKY